MAGKLEPACFHHIHLYTNPSSFYSPARSPRMLPSNPKEPPMASVESSAFFLRDHRTGSEIIVFGDVEPDSVSQEGYNKLVWEAAAPKIASGKLRAIFIECSYNDSTDDAYLYGHMCPRHLVSELSALANKVMEVRNGKMGEKKRKRDFTVPVEIGSEAVSPRSKRNQSTAGDKIEPRSHPTDHFEIPQIPKIGSPAFGDTGDRGDSGDALETPDPESWVDTKPLPLEGLKVYIIHIKENLTDGPPPGDQILKELKAHGTAAHLGCEFFIPSPVEGIWI
jgi:hypothetical protein